MREGARSGLAGDFFAGDFLIAGLDEDFLEATFGAVFLRKGAAAFAFMQSF